MLAMIPFLQQHSVLAAGFLVSFFALLGVEYLRYRRGPLRLNPQGLVDKLNHNQAAVFDLRAKAPNQRAIIHSKRVTEAEILQGIDRLCEPSPDKLPVLVCDYGHRSMQVGQKLRRRYPKRDVAVLRGGLQAWVDASLPLVKG